MFKLRNIICAFLLVNCVCFTAAAQEAPNKVLVTSDKNPVSINAGEVIIVSDPADAAKLAHAHAKHKDEKPNSSVNMFEKNPFELKNDIVEKFKKFLSWDGFETWKILYFLLGITFTLVAMRFSRWFIKCIIGGSLPYNIKIELAKLIAAELAQPFGLLIFSIGFYLSTVPILNSLPNDGYILISRIIMAMGASAVAWGLFRMTTVLDYVLMKKVNSASSGFDNLLLEILRKTLKVVITVMSILFIGQNILGLNISAILAGAGVAGLAVAFAAQDSIANFFGSMMMAVDKLFKVGDVIVVDGITGTVENMGFRSVWIRTDDGHLVAVPNKAAANSKIENISRRPFIKFDYTLSLSYETSVEKLERALQILRDIYKDHEGMKNEKPASIFCSKLSERAINISVSLSYFPADAGKAQDWNSRTNIEIIKRFCAEDIQLLHPASALKHKKDAEKAS